MADALSPELGSYVTLLPSGIGQVVGIADGPNGRYYQIRRAGTSIEESMSKTQLKSVLTPKSQKD